MAYNGTALTDIDQMRLLALRCVSEIGTVAKMVSAAVADVEAWFARGTSATEAPDGANDNSTALGHWKLGVGALGVGLGTDWEETQQPPSTGTFRWVKFRIVYADGSEGWTAPFCLDNELVEDRLKALENAGGAVEVTVRGSGWYSDGSGRYCCDIEADVDSTDRVSVDIPAEYQDTAKLGGMLPVCETRDGYIRLYAEGRPDDMTVQYWIQEG